MCATIVGSTPAVWHEAQVLVDQRVVMIGGDRVLAVWHSTQVTSPSPLAATFWCWADSAPGWQVAQVAEYVPPALTVALRPLAVCVVSS